MYQKIKEDDSLEKQPTQIKHTKYMTQYNANDIYWGLGIENEVYLEFQEKQPIKKQDFIKCCKRERYSVDYFTNYKKEICDNAFRYYIQHIHDTTENENENEKEKDKINIPILLNSNSFIKTDKLNHSKTLYTKLCEPNPKFVGETLIETLQNSENDYFRNTIDKEWLFDGDTIEFNTMYFYNAKLNNVIEELDHHKQDFIFEINRSFKELNIFNSYGKLEIMTRNHPFATFMTNFPKITIFNNGTLHYNITLPTLLNNYCKVKNKDAFIQDHKKAIRIIQWIEPFMISVYGTPDPFSQMTDYPNTHLFSKSSQRCAVSRYIGIGTYDTDIMETGKVLTKTLDELKKCSDLDYWWFHTFYNNNAYTKLNEIGMDINFNKHYNHGIELRFLEHIHDKNKLYESFEFIILLMDFILENNDNPYLFENPIIHKTWNEFVVNIMRHGNTYELNVEEYQLYETIFNIKIQYTKTKDVFYQIYNELCIRYYQIQRYEYEDNKINTFLCIPDGILSKLTIEPHIRTFDWKNLNIPSIIIKNNFQIPSPIDELLINDENNENNENSSDKMQEIIYIPSQVTTNIITQDTNSTNSYCYCCCFFYIFYYVMCPFYWIFEKKNN